MSTPEQYLTADTVRGYSKEFLNALCACGCARVAHRNRSGACGCGCERFAPGQAARAAVEKVYSFGTIGPAALQRTTAGEAPLVEDAPSVNDQPTVAQFMRQLESRVTPSPEEAAPSEPSAPAAPTGTPMLRAGSATRCPFCLADDFESVPSLKCPSCKAWQHQACVQEHKKCAACKSPWTG